MVHHHHVIINRQYTTPLARRNISDELSREATTSRSKETDALPQIEEDKQWQKLESPEGALLFCGTKIVQQHEQQNNNCSIGPFSTSSELAKKKTKKIQRVVLTMHIE